MSVASGQAARVRVAVLVDTSTGWGRRLIEGVNSFAQKQGNWRLWIEPSSRAEATKLPAEWQGDGIIARVVSEPMARSLLATRLPVVNVSGIQLKSSGSFPRITTRYDAAAKLAAEHFIERGFTNFAYIGPLNLSYVRDHFNSFLNVLTHEHHACFSYDYRPGTSSHTTWRKQLQTLADWLTALPKPVGILTWGTTPGIHVLEACGDAGLAVPDEVAVLGGDDDILLCSAAHPPLSGIVTASERIGYLAAETLRTMIDGSQPAQTHVEVDPLSIATRQSTDVLAIGDRDLRQAVVFLRENACKPITIERILANVPVSRRSLERMFRQTFGRTPGEEIRRLRMMRCRELLAQSDLPIPQVAAQCGFASPEHLATLFKREHKVTPLKYRSRARAR
jgi:LacI family transcriptional regulator